MGAFTYVEEYAIEQARIAAAKHHPIVTISVGNDADTGLMQQIADDRPLILVK